MATNLSNNLFQELFVYVPAGKAEEFKQRSYEYKSYIVFIEDTHEIYVNGRSFGYNYDELLEEIWDAIHGLQNDMLQLETDFNEHKEEVDTALQNHKTETIQTITNYQTGVNNTINQINSNIDGLNTQIGTINTTLNNINTSITTEANARQAKDTQLETKNQQQDASINTITNQIGRESQSGTILYRIRQLENRWL